MLILKLLSITLLSYFLVKLIVKYANNLMLVDVPNERSHHCRIIPSGAGIGFIGATIFGLLAFEFELFIENWHVFLALFMVFSIGVVDDRYEVSAKWKFIIIFIAVFVMWFYGVSINTIGTWFGYELILHPYVALLFTMFALAGFTNALNLIDGIDGLSSSVSIVILTFFMFIGIEYQNHLMVVLSTFTIASVVGFMFLNWNPAKIFMGDSGSLSLGFIVSVLAVLSLEYVHPITILYLAAIPILDTLIVMIRRIRRGQSPLKPDKTHLHHILVKFFEMNVKKTVIFMLILQLVFSSIGYMLIGIIHQDTTSLVPVLATFGFALMFVLFYMIFTGIKKRQIAIDNSTNAN